VKRNALIFILLLPLVACGWNHQCTKSRSYNLGEEKIATVGSEMVQNGCYAARWEPQGAIVRLLRSPYDDNYFEPWIDTKNYSTQGVRATSCTSPIESTA
jgi:hypothetical protein